MGKTTYTEQNSPPALLRTLGKSLCICLQEENSRALEDSIFHRIIDFDFVILKFYSLNKFLIDEVQWKISNLIMERKNNSRLVYRRQNTKIKIMEITLPNVHPYLKQECDKIN